MNLIFLTDRIWGNSAYSKVANNIVKRISDEHNVAHIPMGHAMMGGTFKLGDTLIFPAGESPFGEDVAPSHYYEFNADILFTLKEPWNFKVIHDEAINFAPFVVIDHEPVSPHITSKLGTSFKNISISRFGQRQLKNKGIDNHYFPHGVDTKIHKPLDEEGRKLSRKLYYLDEDAFVILMVQMNRARKMIPHQLRGIKIFKEQNPDIHFQVFLWTDIRAGALPSDYSPGVGTADYGVDLLPEISNLGLNNDILWPDAKLIRRGVPEYDPEGWDMVKMYNAADVLLQATGGEAAGLPYLEAQANGITPIGTDYAGASEYVGTGLTVPAKDYICIATPGNRYVIPDEYKIADALSKAANRDREKASRRAKAFAERYDWDVVVDKYFKPFLGSCEKEIYPLVTGEGVKSWRAA
jgi:glycosyltransferase involved in cell wall biosynthesis